MVLTNRFSTTEYNTQRLNRTCFLVEFCHRKLSEGPWHSMRHTYVIEADFRNVSKVSELVNIFRSEFFCARQTARTFMAKPFGIEPVTAACRCSGCGGAATVEALFGLGDLILVRNYCSSCLEDAEYDIETISITH